MIRPWFVSVALLVTVSFSVHGRPLQDPRVQDPGVQAPLSTVRLSQAQQDADAVLRVGVRVAPPFVMADGADGYDGLAIRLWEAVAAAMEVDFVYSEHGIIDLLEHTAMGRLDVAVGALTITAEHEQRLDFTHAWFGTGLGVAANAHHDSGWWAVRLRSAPGRGCRLARHHRGRLAGPSPVRPL